MFLAVIGKRELSGAGKGCLLWLIHSLAHVLNDIVVYLSHRGWQDSAKSGWVTKTWSSAWHMGRVQSPSSCLLLWLTSQRSQHKNAHIMEEKTEAQSGNAT